MEAGELTPNDVRVIRFERLFDEIGVESDARRVANDYLIGLGAYGDLYPGARDLLEGLTKVASLALVSNGIGQVVRDKVRRLDLDRYFDAIVISPGPGRPEQAGISMDLVRAVAGRVPLLGVCLGHQAIARVWGAEIVRAPTLMHGKTSEVFHRNRGVFAGLPQPFEATRYHSLVLSPESLPDCLELLAWTEWSGGHEVMGVKHAEFNVQGVQFHPESILTTVGHDLIRNFLVSVSPSYNA